MRNSICPASDKHAIGCAKVPVCQEEVAIRLDPLEGTRVGEAKRPGPPLKKEVETLKIWSINVGGAGLYRLVEKSKYHSQEW